MKVLVKCKDTEDMLSCVDVSVIVANGLKVLASITGVADSGFIKLAEFDTSKEAEAAVRDAFLQQSVDFTKYNKIKAAAANEDEYHCNYEDEDEDVGPCKKCSDTDCPFNDD